MNSLNYIEKLTELKRRALKRYLTPFTLEEKDLKQQVADKGSKILLGQVYQLLEEEILEEASESRAWLTIYYQNYFKEVNKEAYDDANLDVQIISIDERNKDLPSHILGSMFSLSELIRLTKENGLNTYIEANRKTITISAFLRKAEIRDYAKIKKHGEK